MPGVASFSLVREPSALWSIFRLGTDRIRLRRTPGLRFWRLLGTGAGSSTGPGADLHRSALFAVWDDDAALDAFLAGMGDRWSRSSEVWHVRLRGRGGHGSWHGFDVLGAVAAGRRETGPVAVVTRARVRVASTREFRGASRAVDPEVAASDGLLAVVAFGEAPMSRLGTFSVWRDAAAMRAFAVGGAAHRDAVRRTRDDGWYGEELFARFEPYASSGSWDGRDPLAGIGTSIP